MNNLNANASAFMWHNPQTLPPPSPVQQQQPVQQQSVQQQSVQQQAVQQQAVQQQGVQQVQHLATGQLLHVPAMPQPRKFGGNKSNYNYVQSQAGAMMSPGNPGGGGGPMSAFGSSPGLYRKRYPINTYNTGCYQTNGKLKRRFLAFSSTKVAFFSL